MILKRKSPHRGGLGSGQLRLAADMEQCPKQTGKQARAAVNNDLHQITLLAAVDGS